MLGDAILRKKRHQFFYDMGCVNMKLTKKKQSTHCTLFKTFNRHALWTKNVKSLSSVKSISMKARKLTEWICSWEKYSNLQLFQKVSALRGIYKARIEIRILLYNCGYFYAKITNKTTLIYNKKFGSMSKWSENDVSGSRTTQSLN